MRNRDIARGIYQLIIVENFRVSVERVHTYVPEDQMMAEKMTNYDWERIGNLRKASDGFVYGFSLDADSVFFLQDFAQADFVHDANTGQRFHFPGSAIGDQVFLAGEFNNWEQIAMQRAPRVFTQFGLPLPLSTFANVGKQFKFVANAICGSSHRILLPMSWMQD